MAEILSLSLQMPREPLLVDNNCYVSFRSGSSCPAYFLVPYDILLRSVSLQDTPVQLPVTFSIIVGCGEDIRRDLGAQSGSLSPTGLFRVRWAGFMHPIERSVEGRSLFSSESYACCDS